MAVPPPRFAAAIFDLDGTITDSGQLHWETFNVALQPHGIVIPRATWDRLYEGTGSQHIFEDALAKRGLLGRVSVEELHDRRQALFKEAAMKRLIPITGFARFYDELHRLGVPVMLATNAEERTIALSLSLLKLEELRRVSSRDVGKAKPDPAVYLAACARLGLPPDRCVVFEDSVSGVLAAKRAGCYCVALLTTTTEARLKKAGADLIVKDYTKLSAGLLFSKQY